MHHRLVVEESLLGGVVAFAIGNVSALQDSSKLMLLLLPALFFTTCSSSTTCKVCLLHYKQGN
jgi:hypothetical protein